MTFAELTARADALAAGLRERGAGPQTLVGVHLERSPEMIVAILGVLASGAGYVPLDPEYPESHVRTIVADSAMSILLSRGDGDALCAGTVAERWDPDAWPTRGAAGPEPHDGTAYLIYTSGSTGVPKGVVIERPALLNYLAWCDGALPFTGGGAPLAGTIAFDHAVTVLFPPLLRGEPVTLLPPIRGGRGLADGLLAGIVQLRENHAVAPAHARSRTACGAWAIHRPRHVRRRTRKQRVHRGRST